MKDRNIDFTSILGTGEAQAIQAPVLAQLVGVDSTAELRTLISAARMDGQLILSSHCGYYLPSNDEEIENYVKSMSRRAIMIFSVIKSAKTALAEHKAQTNGEQMTLDDFLGGI